MLSHLQVQDFYARQMGFLIRGRIDEMADLFLYPFTLHERDSVFVMPDHAALVARWSKVLEVWLSIGVADVRPRVAALELPRHGRFRFWSESMLLDAQGRSLGANKVLYFARTDAAGAIRLEMMQLLSAALAAQCPPTTSYLKA